MDLWILCAEKANLIKVDNVYIEEFYDREMTHYYEIRTKKDDDEICLGCFETKERAKEVIGEILKLLMSQDIMVFHNIGLDCDKLDALHKKIQETKWVGLCDSNLDSKVEYISPNSVVFEMPKE